MLPPYSPRYYFLVVVLVMTTCIAAESKKPKENNFLLAETAHSKPTHPFMNVETSCSGESLLIMASFNEPFYGLLYANGFPSSSSCRVEGTGNRLLRLVFNVSECGIRFISMEDGSRQLDLSLYLQYDAHVQQAVDEKVATRCKLQAERPVEERPTDSIHRSSAVFSALEKLNRRIDPVVPSSTTTTTTSTTKPTPSIRPLVTIANVTNNTKNPALPLTSYQAKKLEMNRDGKISSVMGPSLVTSGVLKLNHQQSSPLQRQDTVSCWMDIVAGTDPTGRPVETYLRVGQDATIVIRVRQQAGLDTRLTSCVAHDGSHDSHQDLLDADGCSLDTNILPNVQEKILSRSSTETTKLLFASFRSFRFPDRDYLHVKCTVVVCKGKCLMNACNLIRRKGRGATGSFRPLTPQEMAEVNVRQVSSALRNNDRSNKGSTNRESTSSRRHGSTRSSNLTSLITNFGSIVDKVEVYNSVEVRVASSSAPSPTHPEDLIKSTRGFSPRSAATADEEIEEAVFCLTPSKLFMAFGILFAILVSAMLFAVCVCIRVRTNKNSFPSKLASNQQLHNPYSSSPPRYLNSSPRPPAPMMNPACHVMRHPSSINSRHQYPMSRHSSASPYVRVFK